MLFLLEKYPAFLLFDNLFDCPRIFISIIVLAKMQISSILSGKNIIIPCLFYVRTKSVRRISICDIKTPLLNSKEQ